MKIEILGDGCKRCKTLNKKVQQAIDELKITADITSVMDPARIADLGLLSLPQVIVDGRVASGRALNSVESIKELLCAATDRP